MITFAVVVVDVEILALGVVGEKTWAAMYFTPASEDALLIQAANAGRHTADVLRNGILVLVTPLLAICLGIAGPRCSIPRRPRTGCTSWLDTLS